MHYHGMGCHPMDSCFRRNDGGGRNDGIVIIDGILDTVLPSIVIDFQTICGSDHSSRRMCEKRAN